MVDSSKTSRTILFRRLARCALAVMVIGVAVTGCVIETDGTWYAGDVQPVYDQWELSPFQEHRLLEGGLFVLGGASFGPGAPDRGPVQRSRRIPEYDPPRR